MPTLGAEAECFTTELSPLVIFFKAVSLRRCVVASLRFAVAFRCAVAFCGCNSLGRYASRLHIEVASLRFAVALRCVFAVLCRASAGPGQAVVDENSADWH